MIEEVFRDIATGEGGIPWIRTIATRTPGPNVIVNAVAHGNEHCGLHALEWILGNSDAIRRGTVTLVVANPKAAASLLEAGAVDRRFVDRDFNRLWNEVESDAGANPDTSVEASRARELLPVYRRGDILIDLHSLGTDGAPILMYHPTERALDLARRLPQPLTHVQFARPLHNGGLLVEQSRYLDRNDRAAFVLECGAHGLPTTNEVAVVATARLLFAAGLIDEDRLPDMPWFEDPAPMALLAHEMLYARADNFRFEVALNGVQPIEPGTIYARDDSGPYIAPQTPFALVLPRARPKAGGEAALLATPVSL